MNRKWLKDPFFWITVFVILFLLYGLYQIQFVLIGLTNKVVGLISGIKIPEISTGSLEVTFTVFFIIFSLLCWFFYRKKPEPKPEEKKKDDPKKKDDCVAKSESKPSLFYPLILLLVVICAGTFWKDDVSVFIRETGTVISKSVLVLVEKIKPAYRTGTLTRWSRDDKTNLPLPPKTFPIKIQRWDKQKILIEVEITEDRIGILEWDRKKNTEGTWYDPTELSGTWQVRSEKSDNGEYAGWMKSDKWEEKHPLIIKIN